MSDNSAVNFITGDDLNRVIEAQTSADSRAFARRDFVEPLIKFCSDGNYNAKIGVLFGLRSTGKTVGMLQAADELIKNGRKVAYVSLKYERNNMFDATAAISQLALAGYTHFFVDEAPYLNGFMVDSAEWADTLVTKHHIKIVVSGTDSFELWLTMKRALYHRFVRFSTNGNSYPEYKRVWGGGYDDYKFAGGVFLQSNSREAIDNFIDSAVVDNLLHTLEHCHDNPGSSEYYYDWLFGIDKQVIYHGVISILESTVARIIRANFVQYADQKILPRLGDAIKDLSVPSRSDLKQTIIDSLSVYDSFHEIENPKGTIEALTNFLVKIGCMAESEIGTSDLGDLQKTYYFTHNALMNYAVDAAIAGIMKVSGLPADVTRQELSASLRQAAEGALNENIVYAHLLAGAVQGDKVFKYHDSEERDVDAVIINRESKRLILFEIKSKGTVNPRYVWTKEAKHLLDPAILKQISVDDSYEVVRVVAYRGESQLVVSKTDVLLLIKIESLLENYRDVSRFIGRKLADAKQKQREAYPPALLDKLDENIAIAKAREAAKADKAGLRKSDRER